VTVIIDDRDTFAAIFRALYESDVKTLPFTLYRKQRRIRDVTLGGGGRKALKVLTVEVQ